MIQHNTVNTNFTSISSVKTHQFITDRRNEIKKSVVKALNQVMITSDDFLNEFLSTHAFFVSTERYLIFLWISVISEYKPDFEFTKNTSP